MLFAPDPSDPSLGGFTRVAFASSIPRQALPAGSCSYNTTRGRIRDPDPPARFFEPGAACLRRDRPAEHHRTRSANSHQRRAPPAGYPSTFVVSPNPEGQESPSYHRQDQDPASQHTPRRVCLGYRPGAFHYRPSGTSDSFSEPIRVTPDSLAPPLLPAHVTVVPFVPPECR
jgi:hypothetical protein